MHHIDNIIDIIKKNKLNLEKCSILEIGCNIGNDDFEKKHHEN
jgi:hypothetical protein